MSEPLSYKIAVFTTDAMEAGPRIADWIEATWPDVEDDALVALTGSAVVAMLMRRVRPGRRAFFARALSRSLLAAMDTDDD